MSKEKDKQTTEQQRVNYERKASVINNGKMHWTNVNVVAIIAVEEEKEDELIMQ